MKQKRIFILAYTRQNLGDDLFIYMLLNRYPNIQFHINIEKKEHAKLFENFENITIYQSKGRKLTKENVNEYDGYIYIGGSIFMENIGSNYTVTEELLLFMEECKKQKIPFHYVSSNFGPYITQNYLNLTKEVLSNCTSIYFRDRYSANLFDKIDTVHYAPDLAFSYLPEKTEKKVNSIGISIINLNIRSKFKEYIESYYQMLIKNIKEYIKQNKSVTLISFCKYEGDEGAIDEIMSRLPENLKEKINILKYDGNIEYFLNEYSKMEYMVCSRFHSMILSVIMNQKCKVISYSDKIDNVIKDLDLFDKDQIIHLEDINYDTNIILNTFKQVYTNKIEDIRSKSTFQLSEVDKTLI